MALREIRVLGDDLLRKKSREVNFKLKKTKILVLEARKMILGAYYG